MILQVFTVYDKAVCAFLQPFYCRATGEAIRSFTEACNDPKNNFGRHASDYYLVKLGEFDDASGLFACGEPVRIVSAVECVSVADIDRSVATSGANGGYKWEGFDQSPSERATDGRSPVEMMFGKRA